VLFWKAVPAKSKIPERPTRITHKKYTGTAPRRHP
jgi:hypothetical protein